MRNLIELLEAQEFAVLLETPQRAAWLLQNFGPKLEAKYKEEEASGQVPANVKADIDGQTPDDLPSKIIAYIMAADPTQNKAYSRWIALRFLKDNQKLEDINEILTNTLSVFARASAARRVNGNIDTIRTFSDLYTVVEPFLLGDREVSANMDRKNKRNTNVDTRVARQWDVDDPMREQAKVLLDTDDYMVLIPETHEAAIYFGKNTNWCTTIPTASHYRSYTQQGPLYIILRRKDGRRWQFHFETQQFMDERDNPIDLDEFIDENPAVFDAIGPTHFFAIAVNDVKWGPKISLRHFSPELVAKQPDNLVAKTIYSMKDFKALPKERTRRWTFFEGLVPRLHPESKVIPEKDAEALRQFYFKLFTDPAPYVALCREHNWLLKNLPVSLQSDEAKLAVSTKCYDYPAFDSSIPKPWPNEVEERYWELRSKHDIRLTPEEVPEEFLSDHVLGQCLAHRPEFTPKYESRLNDAMVHLMIDMTIEEPNDLYQVVRYLPEKYRTKKLQREVMAMAAGLKRKEQQVDRDQYMRVLSLFDHSMWPMHAHKIIDRLTTVNPNFTSNPPEFHTSAKAAQWVAHYPTFLHEIPEDLITQEVVDASLVNHEGESKPTALFFKQVLEPCDPDVVPVKYVAHAIKQLGDLSSSWTGIPEKYLTREMIDALLVKGEIPLDDPRFPEDAYTPDNVFARFRVAVPTTFKHKVSKEEADEDARKAGRERASGWGHLVDRPNIEAMKRAWDQIPPTADKKAILIKLMEGVPRSDDYIMGRGGQPPHPGFGYLATVVDKSLLDSDVLTAWLKSQPSYGVSHDIFKVFPKSAYTSENMAIAVEKGVIKKAPDHLQDDGVIITQLIKDAKHIDWAKVTPELAVAAIEKDGYHVANSFRYHGKDQTKLLSDPRVIAAFLASKNKTSRIFSMDGTNTDQLQSIYGDRPELRTKWTQEFYNETAGDIIALKDIPKDFWTDKVKLRAVEKDANNIALLTAVIPWLNANGNKLPDIIRAKMLAQGIADTDKGWVDFRDAKRETVPGVPGSYSVVDLKPQGKVLMLFDDNGNCVNGIMAKVPGTMKNSHSGGTYMFASSVGKGFNLGNAATQSLSKYRLLIADATDKHPDFLADLPRNGYDGEDVGAFRQIWLYPQDGELMPVERMKRETVPGSDLTFVKPEKGRSYEGTKFYMFDGNGGMVGVIIMEQDGRGIKISGVSLDSNTPMSRLLELSKGFAQFIDDQGVTSGNNPTFLATDLYKKLGVRGPGKFVWYSLLDEKIVEKEGLSVWKNDQRLTIASNKTGVMWSVKLTKHGFNVEYRSNDAQGKDSSLMKMVDAARALL